MRVLTKSLEKPKKTLQNTGKFTRSRRKARAFHNLNFYREMQYIVIRYAFKALNPSVQYYSNNGSAKNHFWSFADRNAKLFNNLEDAQQAQSFAHEDNGMMLAVIQWSEELRQPDNKEIGTFAGLEYKAWELGLKVIY